MKLAKKLMIVALPLALAAGCTELGSQDRAMVEKANASADAAKSEAMKATDAANKAAAEASRAAEAARMAADAANKAAAEAKAAGDKADRIFRRGLRK
jgi:membrane protein involved in colicin uptake